MRRFSLVGALTVAHIIASFCFLAAFKAAKLQALAVGYSPFLLPSKIAFRVFLFPLVELAVRSGIVWPRNALVLFFVPLNSVLWALLIFFLWKWFRRAARSREYAQRALGLNDE